VSVSFDRLYWMRIGFGVLGGVAAYFSFKLQGGVVGEENGFFIAILVYLASFYVARYLLFKKVPADKLGKLYTVGIGGFVMLYIFTWILLFTLSQI